MKLPFPPVDYSRDLEAQRNALIEQADAKNRKRDADIEIKEPVRLILVSPNGTRFKLTVDNLGILTATTL